MTAAVQLHTSTAGSSQGHSSAVGGSASSLLRGLFLGAAGAFAPRPQGRDRFERAGAASVFDRHGAPLEGATEWHPAEGGFDWGSFEPEEV
ncbi:MAG TPA: hypothetical protein PK413_05645 [Thermoanaerobaculia bacterium]|nr:hypothetical protein [Thermoanaerobaculia bacterium]